MTDAKDHVILKRVTPAAWDGIYHRNWDVDYQATLMTQEKAGEYVAKENAVANRLFDRVAIKLDLPV